MDQIYCLMVAGGNLVEKTRTTLFVSAQEMIKSKDRKLRLRKSQHGVDGEMKTSYKMGFLGTVSGFVFTAEFDTEDQHVTAAFLVRPAKNLDELTKIAVWRRGLLPVPSVKPELN